MPPREGNSPILVVSNADRQAWTTVQRNSDGRYSMRERLAQWLLMCHDRLGSDDLPLTREFLSLMLGVRRSGVTDEVHVLEGLGLLKATRGHISILDRSKL